MIEPWPTTVVRRSCGSGPRTSRPDRAVDRDVAGEAGLSVRPTGPPRRDALMVIVTRPFGRRDTAQRPRARGLELVPGSAES